MKMNQVALQLYTLRNYLGTPEAVETTLRKVAAMGYPAVQISGMPSGVLTEAELLALCQKLGLTICATHEPGSTILEDVAKVISRLKALNCRYTAYPYPAGIDMASPESVAGLIRGLNKAGESMAQIGQVLTYHNHHTELQKVNGQVVLERIYGETDPKFLQGEIDTYWIHYGGSNPADWCRRLAGRLPLLHMKDYVMTSDGTPRFGYIGEGNLNFRAIIEEADKSGCQWFIVEQDTCPGDPFEAIHRSLDYLGKNLIS
jgi:sugar phosphate isomerase/epimerase